jgi:hypothetical protein
MKTNSTESVVGITGGAYHGIMLFLVSFGIVGNTSVIVWRCFLKESRYSLLSALIVSLAAADLLYCMHFLFQEALLFQIVFTGESRNHTFTDVDESLCLVSTFMTFLSANSAVLTTAGIAANTLLSLKGYQRSRSLVLYIVFCWAFSLSIATAATLKLRAFFDTAHASSWILSSESYSLRIVYGCMGNFNMIFPVITCSLNAAVTVVCIIIYSCVAHRLEKFRNAVRGSELRALQIRLSIIVLLNVICWWTADALYLYSYTRSKNMLNGQLSPKASEPALLFTALVSAVNPIIYTIASTKFYRCLCRECYKRRTVQLTDSLIPSEGNDTVAVECCCCCCYKLFRQKEIDSGEVIYLSAPTGYETNNTETESLCSEIDVEEQEETRLQELVTHYSYIS